MNIKNLPLKFTILAGIIALAVLALSTTGIKKGIDIAGGHSMTFEIKSNAPEIKNIEATIEELKTQLAAATKPDDKTAIQRQIDENVSRVKELREADSSGDVRGQIIKTLKERIDPLGSLDIAWIPQQNNRIEIRMPVARKETEIAKNAYLEAVSGIESKNILASKVKLAIDDPANRQARIDSLVKTANGGAALADEIKTLISQHDAIVDLSAKLANVAATGPASTQPEKINNSRENMKYQLDVLEGDYNKAIASLLAKYNIDIPQLSAILKLYVSDVEKKAIGKEEADTRTAEFQDRTKKFIEAHPTRKAEIEKAIELYQGWVKNRLLLDDPSDLKRLIAKVGVLEFRIAPLPGKDQIDATDVLRYQEELKAKGPDMLNRKSGKFMWFPVRNEREGYGYLYTGEYAGITYVLLFNTPDNTMLQRGGQNKWSLEDARPQPDEKGLPALDFRFDARGAAIFRALTSSHLKQPMAILLDNEVYSAPTIQSTISDRGQITGKFTTAEVDDLVRILKAGSLPAKLNPVPVSESTFGPALGQQNLDQAVKAGLWCMIVIVAFMTIYYFIAGCVANFAMMLNVLFILGAMSWLNQVLTLPGIAGLILSIGMAVDANVLIYERLREEQDKGQSPRMSLKNAYEKAFSAIFDSNITTLISCLILGWVGSEEIRGFAITLGLGVLFNLFTAVTVTKWIFQTMLDTGVVKKRFSMLRLIGVPKIDWMGKRYYFWAFSLITGILGLVAFLSAGKNILGIEFSAGTQAIVRMKDDATLRNNNGTMNLPDEKLVENRIKATAEKLRKEAESLRDQATTPQQKSEYQTAMSGYAKIEDGRVERLIDPKHFATFWDEHFKDFKGDAITRDDWKKAKLNEQMFDLMDKSKAGKVTKKDFEAALADKSSGYQLTTTESDLARIRKVVREAFETNLNIRMKSDYKLVKGPQDAAKNADKFANKVADGLGALLPDGTAKIDRKLIASAKNISTELSDYEGGVLMVIKDVSPALTAGDLKQRIRLMRTQPDQKDQSLKPTEVVGLDAVGDNAFSSFAIMVRPSESLGNDADAWKKFAENEANLVNLSLSREEAIEATNFDPALAGKATEAAIVALVLGWLAMIIYLWVRFGQARWGLAAVLCLMHDVLIIVGMVAISNLPWVYDSAIGKALMIQPFKIDLTMIAALLTIIGYSVNDTIVVFDRIRENRGKLATVTPAIINGSINQTLSRTLLTAGTVFVVVFIMYVWGGAGLHSFNYAFLIGVLFGTYSSIAVAAPMLLGFKGMMHRSMDTQSEQAGK